MFRVERVAVLMDVPLLGRLKSLYRLFVGSPEQKALSCDCWGIMLAQSKAA